MQKWLILLLCLSGFATAEIPDDMPDDIKQILLTGPINTMTGEPIPAPAPSSRSIELYTSSFGISDEQAISMLNVKPKYRMLVHALEEYIGDRLAGSWIQHTPDYRLIYLLKGNEDVPQWMNSMVADNVLTVEVRLHAQYSKTELLEMQDIITDLTAEGFPEIQGSGIAERENAVAIDVYSTSEQDNLIFEEKLKERLSDVSIPIKLTFYDTKAVLASGTQPGGNRIGPNGVNKPFCTVGFAGLFNVTQTKGFMTAAHCLQGNKYFKNLKTGKRYKVKYGSQKWDAERDVQLFGLMNSDGSIANQAPTNKIVRRRPDGQYYAEFRTTKIATRKDHKLGEVVCKASAVTYFTCGFIQHINYRPKHKCNGKKCANTYVKVSRGKPGWPDTGTPLKCFGGDSGGPVTEDYNIALGIVISAAFKSNKWCAFFTYMPIHYVEESFRYIEVLIRDDYWD